MSRQLLSKQEPVGLLIGAARRRIKQAVGHRLRGYGLTPQQFWVLVNVREREGLALHELAERLHGGDDVGRELAPVEKGGKTIYGPARIRTIGELTPKDIANGVLKELLPMPKWEITIPTDPFRVLERQAHLPCPASVREFVEDPDAGPNPTLAAVAHEA